VENVKQYFNGMTIRRDFGIQSFHHTSLLRYACFLPLRTFQ